MKKIIYITGKQGTGKTMLKSIIRGDVSVEIHADLSNEEFYQIPKYLEDVDIVFITSCEYRKFDFKLLKKYAKVNKCVFWHLEAKFYSHEI